MFVTNLNKFVYFVKNLTINYINNMVFVSICVNTDYMSIPDRITKPLSFDMEAVFLCLLTDLLTDC
jgi:hypothetical protein